MSYGYNPGNDLNMYQMNPPVLPLSQVNASLNDGLMRSGLSSDTINQPVTYTEIVNRANDPTTMTMMNMASVGNGNSYAVNSTVSGVVQNVGARTVDLSKASATGGGAAGASTVAVSFAGNNGAMMNMLPTYTTVIGSFASNDKLATMSAPQMTVDWKAPTATNW